MATDTKQHLSVPIKGMTCASCVSHVANALEEVSGLEAINVNLATEKASFDVASSDTHLAEIVHAIEDAGYGIGTEKISLSIGNMTCASCVGHVENALKKVDGVASANVNLATERASVDFIPGIVGVSDLRHAVEDSGYPVLGIIGDENDDASTPKEVSVLRIKLVVSLIVSGVIMAIMAIGPIKEALPFRMDYLLLVLAAPIQFWAGRQFYKGAWGAAKHRTTNMNTLIAVGDRFLKL